MPYSGYVFLREAYDRTYLETEKQNIITYLQTLYTNSEFRQKYNTWNNKYTVYSVRKLPFLSVKSNIEDYTKEKNRLIISYFDTDEQEYSCQLVLTDEPIDPTGW